MLTLQTAPLPELLLGPVRGTCCETYIELESAKFDLSLHITQHQPCLSGHREYSRALFHPATIERLTAHWQNLLQAVVHNPDQSPASLPLLTPRELQALRVGHSTAHR
jgi:non-ribosomal peptide synthetase component F